MEYESIIHSDSYNPKSSSEGRVVGGKDLSWALKALDSDVFEMPAVCH
jgi:hypothetical protein